MNGGFPAGPGAACLSVGFDGSEGRLRTTPHPELVGPGSFPVSLDVFTATCLELDAVESISCGLPLRKASSDLVQHHPSCEHAGSIN